jgi:hypothetical protein
MDRFATVRSCFSHRKNVFEASKTLNAYSLRCETPGCVPMERLQCMPTRFTFVHDDRSDSVPLLLFIVRLRIAKELHVDHNISKALSETKVSIVDEAGPKPCSLKTRLLTRRIFMVNKLPSIF